MNVRDVIRELERMVDDGHEEATVVVSTNGRAIREEEREPFVTVEWSPEDGGVVIDTMND